MMKPTSLLAFILLLAACKKETFDVQNLNGGRIDVLGHGGSGIHSLYPLSSGSSILACLHTDADGSEVDVQITRDSVLVAFHSNDLSEGTDLSGPVSSRTWAEIQAARYTAIPYHAEPILRLDPFFTSAAVAQGRTFSLDLKVNPGTEPEAAYIERFARALVRLIDAHGLSDRIYLESQHSYMLVQLRALRPSLRTFYYPPTFDEGLALANELDLFGVSISTTKCTAEQVRQAHDQGRWIILWDVYSKGDNEAAVRKNPDIIQTDRIDHLLRLLDR